MQTKRRKVLAVAVALSVLTSNTAINNMQPACIPEDQLARFERQTDKGKSKRKNKKGYFV